MSEQNKNEQLIEMFLFETSQLIEQLEQKMLDSEKENNISKDCINEIFRIMHTIKGSAAMMAYDDISTLAHSVEDIFFYIREEHPNHFNCSLLSDLILNVVDFIKIELEKIKNHDDADGISIDLIKLMKDYLSDLKRDNTEPIENYSGKSYTIVLHFEDGCEMENIRAFTIVQDLKDSVDEIKYIPEDIMENDESIQRIRNNGFVIKVRTDKSYEWMNEYFQDTIYLSDFELKEDTIELEENREIPVKKYNGKTGEKNCNVQNRKAQANQSNQSLISVSISKLDKLMDLVGEMVISEAMVIQNPDLKGLELNNFKKAAGQLNKITSEIQDMVMSIRMVPLSGTFQKMNRIVRDMSKKLEKEVELELIGNDTEVDKNIIEHISDPIMHLVRNAIDHGIESKEEREKKGKNPIATITLEAKDSGGDVLIFVRDDGRGLDKDKILKKAKENNLLYKSEKDMTEKEIFQLILLPGFSTKDNVTEYSGRGVGMDVVMRNIESIGGFLSVNSAVDKGTEITLKIPLTLAIIDGMNIRVGDAYYTLPIHAIKESFRPKKEEIIIHPDGNEMIMVRGQCYQVKRLHRIFQVKTDITDVSEGILIMIEQDGKTSCIFADDLLGQQQVVVKALPKYIRNFKKIQGLAGCTLLGDGSISLILDVAGLMNV